MKIYRRCENVSFTESAVGVGLGNFDGIHLGHASLLSMLTMQCKKLNIPSMVYTFREHPDSILFKESLTPLIMTENQKLQMLEEKEVDLVYLEEFDEKYASISPEDFVKNILVDTFHIKLAVVGFNYSFGAMGRGKGKDLEAFGKKYGFDVYVMPPVETDGAAISSTRIRALIKEGNMEKFKAYTGRYYSIPGEVLVGRKIGRTLGFPTANILPKEGFALPAMGVYLTQTLIDGKMFHSITNIGIKPTFEKELPVTVETHIIEYNKGLYGENIEVFFVKKLRDEKKFNNVEMLIEQLNEDLSNAKKIIKERHEF